MLWFTWLVRVLSCLIVLVAAQRLQAVTADEATARTGISGGLCVIDRAGEAEADLALQLAERPSCVVQVRTGDRVSAHSLTARGEAAGQLGRRLYVDADRSEGPALPYADHAVDLLVIGDLVDADLTASARAEWQRVLSGGRGVALVGRSAERGPGLSRSALEAWAAGGTGNATILADASGTWALLRGRLPVGADGWTHRLHGPDQCQVSQDTAFQAPFLSQWWGLPRQDGMWGSTMVAGRGRLFSMRSSRQAGQRYALTARGLGNGVMLWQRIMRSADATEVDNYDSGRSCIALDGDTVLIIAGDSVLRLAAESGKELARIVGPRPGGGIKWIGVADGLLAVLAGDRDVHKPAAFRYQKGAASNPTGSDLAVYETVTGREQWKATVAGSIDERLIALRDHRLYTLAEGVGLECRDLGSGARSWLNADPDIQRAFRSPEPRRVAAGMLSKPGLVALPDQIVLCAKWAEKTMAFASNDGRLLWSKIQDRPGGARADNSIAFGKLWLDGGTAFDLFSGQPATAPPTGGGGCGPPLWTPRYWISAFGSVSELRSGKAVRTRDIKSPCDQGTIIADGIMVTMPSECSCGAELKGYRALAAAGSFADRPAVPWQQRLQVDAAVNHAPPTALPVDAADWPVSRGNQARGGACAAVVGQVAAVRWRWSSPGTVAPPGGPAVAGLPRLDPDFIATTPLTAAGRAWFVSHDGVVRCLDAANGESRWTTATGTMVLSPPTLWQGHLLIGGGDGNVRCLDASTGHLRWRFQVAPHDRRTFWFGHLVNTWPVLPEIVIDHGTAYAMAGFQSDNGVTCAAIDVATGAVRWETAGTSRIGPTAVFGHAAVGGGRLWMTGGTGGSFALPGGEWAAGPALHGAECGIFSERWLIAGGRRITETAQDALDSPMQRAEFTASPLDRASTRHRPLGADSAPTPAIPVWDAALFVLAARADRTATCQVTAVPAAAMNTWLATFPDDKHADQPALATVQAWSVELPTPLALALSQDLVIVAHADRQLTPPVGKIGTAAVEGVRFQLSGLNRRDGSRTWSIALPAQPAPNRLSIDRDGRVLVCLIDGTVVCVGR
ncbi:hypothetical protein LBMAG53_17110 [Planctomycetota bacterium]|nr:hypothetical protein LBMAG53_17110 [Planctomycetota bacterium]